MIPVYYFEKMPEKLPDDDACYIVSKHIYLKKRSGLIDSMIQVPYINMGEVLPEYARMKLPKIKAKVFGKVVGFFKMAFKNYKSESGVILNLKTHPKNQKLQKIDYTIPHQRVSSGRCKYNIVIDPSYINCGTIHCHSDFGAFHSTIDENDERYFDGLHITVGHIDMDEVSISACIVINSKRVKVNPCDYIEGIENVKEEQLLRNTTEFYKLLDQSLIVSNGENLKFVTPITQPQSNPSSLARSKDWSEWIKGIGSNEVHTKIPTSACEECVFKEVKIKNLLDDVVFDDDDVPDLYDNISMDDMLDDTVDTTFTEQDKILFEKDSIPIFSVGETDEDGVKRHDNSIPSFEFEAEKNVKLKRSIKCDGCESTFFVENPEVTNACPSCEKEKEGASYTITDFLSEKRMREGESTDL